MAKRDPTLEDQMVEWFKEDTMVTKEKKVEILEIRYLTDRFGYPLMKGQIYCNGLWIGWVAVHGQAGNRTMVTTVQSEAVYQIIKKWLF
jgi:hypothetical protein